MSPFKLEVITAERVVYSDDVDSIVVPGNTGELGILPHHTPLMSALQPGELAIRKGEGETFIALSGGFIEVRPDRVIVLAEAAERSDEIDIARAEAARKRAEESLKTVPHGGVQSAEAEAALRRALARIKVVQKRRQRPTV